jgi:hypothetical protein
MFIAYSLLGMRSFGFSVVGYQYFNQRIFISPMSFFYKALHILLTTRYSYKALFRVQKLKKENEINGKRNNKKTMIRFCPNKRGNFKP